MTAVDGVERELPLAATEAAERRATIEPSTGRERPPPKATIAAGLALLVAVAGVAFAVTRERPGSPSRTRSTAALSEVVVQVDPEREPPIVRSIPVPVPRVSVPGVTLPTSAHSMVVGQGGVWTVRFRYLFHVDPSRSELEDRLPLEFGISFSVNLAESSDKIWVAYDGGLDEVNPATGDQREVIVSATGRPVANDVAFGAGYVWLGGSDGRLVRFDPMTGRDLARTSLDPIDAIAYGHGSVWTVDTVGGTVTRYDPGTMRSVEEIEMPTAADYVVSGDVAVWALSTSVGTLSRIDPSTNDVAIAGRVGANPSGLAAGSGAVWVGDEDGIIRRVDEDTRAVTDIPFGAEIRALAFDDETGTSGSTSFEADE